METIRLFLHSHWLKLVVPLAVFALTLVSALGAKRLFFRVLRVWQPGTKSRTGPIVVEALEGPFMIWALILALELSIRSSVLPEKITGYSEKVLLSLWILSFTLMAVRLTGELVRFYGSRVEGLLPVTTLTQNLAQLGIGILGLLLILRHALGWEITPILTALGVGGLAVALALQDTLSNLFAGFYVAVSGQVRLGDYIKLNTGEEGYISDITWRSTTIRSLSNNLIVVPNAKLGQANVTNYYLPDKRLSIGIQVTVAFESQPEQVERVLLEEAAAGPELPGLLADPAPSVTFEPGFVESGLGFTLNCHIREFADQYAIRSLLRKRILHRFRREGIVLPYPTRTVYVREKGS